MRAFLLFLFCHANGLISHKYILFLRIIPFAGAGLWGWGAFVEGVSEAPWRIPLRTALVCAPLDTEGD